MTSAPPSDPLIGQLIDNRYQVRSRIARGGMATVYLATDLRLERRVAVKIMHSHLADDSNFKLRFVQEARSTARLAHPNVVSVFDQGQDADMAYLVMEYLPGITLRELLRDYKKLTPEQTVDIMDSVLAGLAAAHRAGIVHRDIKPENVLLADDGRIKLGDFGLARAATQATGSGQALLGTIAYLSPELLTRGVADARSDIYAIGIMMYEMLTGEQPFRGDQPMQIAYQHANEQVPAPSILNPAVPPALDELVLWATTRDPAQRPKDASQLLEALRDAERDARHSDLTAQVGGGRAANNLVAASGGIPAATTPQEPADDLTEVFSEEEVAAAPTTAMKVARKKHNSKPPGVLRSSDGQVDPAEVTEAAPNKPGRRRHRLRAWLVAIVVVVLLAGGGAVAWSSWYYSSGPGELVAVPQVIGKTEVAARQVIGTTFYVTHKGEYSLKVPLGEIITTTPVEGTKLHKGDKVTLTVSQGPQPVTIPAIAGMALSDARNKLQSLGETVAPNPAQQFSDTVAANTVISATRTSDKKDFTQGGPAYQGQEFSLVVSVGAVPDVVGMPLAQAQQTLTSVGLKFSEDPAAYSDTVPNGNVISATPQAAQGAPITPGITYVLVASKGPQLFPVPNVVGQTLNVAIQTLQNAGFTPSYPNSVGIFPVKGFESGYTVQSQSPAANSGQQKGATITLALKIGPT